MFYRGKKYTIIFVSIKNFSFINISTIDQFTILVSIFNLIIFRIYILVKATNQDLLLDLQRDAIDSLHKRIRYLKYDKCLIISTLHTMYSSILSVVQV